MNASTAKKGMMGRQAPTPTPRLAEITNNARLSLNKMPMFVFKHPNLFTFPPTIGGSSEDSPTTCHSPHPPSMGAQTAEASVPLAFFPNSHSQLISSKNRKTCPVQECLVSAPTFKPPSNSVTA